ncbi:alpha,alpha-phosphotrehalase [[Clostridium] innocuum]|nr:alpha,alpha-phosphotrehalase [[Clostridium] innocuum]
MNFKEKTVYQIYPKSFQDSNGDGWGDLQGVISRLDYLQKLGIDYIWFNAMFVSPQRDNGYDVEDYLRIDERYGTMDDFTQLCREAKKRGIDIMLDMVFNHTSTQHAWFQRALNGEEKYKKYYFFRKGKADGSAPTNWQSKFGGPAWEYVEQLDEYYLHLFDVTQADLNWDNPEVRRELADIVNFWRSKGVHGFRFDVVNLVSKSCFEDDPNLFDGRQFYTDGPHIHEYLKELNLNSFGNDTDSMTVGEMSSTTLENCVHYSGAQAHELTSVFTFHHLKVDYKEKKKWELMPFDFMELKQLLNDWQTGMQEADAWNALFWCNHDQPRALSRFCDDQNYRIEAAKMLATTLHCMRGTPYVYQGEEIGMTNAYYTHISQYRDVESTNFYEILKAEGRSKNEILHVLQERSRDNARTPMQWSAEKNAGFTNQTPWIPVIDNYKEINVENALQDEASIFYHYQKLIRMRKEYPLIQDGRFIPILETHKAVFAYKRVSADDELLVLSNFYPEKTNVELKDIDGYERLLSNYKDSRLQTEMTLRPYESVIFYRTK